MHPRLQNTPACLRTTLKGECLLKHHPLMFQVQIFPKSLSWVPFLLSMVYSSCPIELGLKDTLISQLGWPTSFLKGLCMRSNQKGEELGKSGPFGAKTVQTGWTAECLTVSQGWPTAIRERPYDSCMTVFMIRVGFRNCSVVHFFEWNLGSFQPCFLGKLFTKVS